MEHPVWVLLALWGLGSRSMVLVFCVISIVVATTLCLFVSWWGGLVYLAAAWYWFAMRWVDKFDRW